MFSPVFLFPQICLRECGQTLCWMPFRTLPSMTLAFPRQLSFPMNKRSNMATFVATTASNGARLKDPEAVREILDRYFWDGDVTASIQTTDGEESLVIYGYDRPGAWKIPDGVNQDEFEPDYDLDPCDGLEDFLKEVAPYLAEPLTVHAAGAEKCRFPLSACEWHIRPGETTIEVNGFNHSE